MWLGGFTNRSAPISTSTPTTSNKSPGMPPVRWPREPSRNSSRKKRRALGPHSPVPLVDGFVPCDASHARFNSGEWKGPRLYSNSEQRFSPKTVVERGTSSPNPAVRSERIKPEKIGKPRRHSKKRTTTENGRGNPEPLDKLLGFGLSRGHLGDLNSPLGAFACTSRLASRLPATSPRSNGPSSRRCCPPKCLRADPGPPTSAPSLMPPSTS